MKNNIIDIKKLREKRTTKQVAETLCRLISKHQEKPDQLSIRTLERLILNEINTRG